MTRIRLTYLDKEVIKPVSNVKTFIRNLRMTDHKFISWSYA